MLNIIGLYLVNSIYGRSILIGLEYRVWDWVHRRMFKHQYSPVTKSNKNLMNSNFHKNDFEHIAQDDWLEQSTYEKTSRWPGCLMPILNSPNSNYPLIKSLQWRLFTDVHCILIHQLVHLPWNYLKLPENNLKTKYIKVLDMILS